MSLPRTELWERIRTFSFDEGQPTLSFAERLARENGWTIAFAARVVIEYKKFIYLAVEAGHPVTPSNEVDQAWHLHLTYTRSYWDRLCGEVLGRALHHGPTRGGDDEDVKYWEWYQSTLESYQKVFGAEPPSDIWPPAAMRFDHPEALRRIDTRRFWLVPKQPSKRWAALASVIAAMGLMTGCGAMLMQSGTLSSGQAFAVVIVAMMVVFVIACLVGSMRRKSRRGNSRRNGGCGGWFWMGCGSGGCSSGSSGCSSGDGGSSGCGSSGCGGGGCGGGGGCSS